MSDIVTVGYLCIGCPLGCRLEVDEDPATHALVEVRGYSCRLGKEYAIQEHTAPQRLVTTTVAVEMGCGRACLSARVAPCRKTK